MSKRLVLDPAVRLSEEIQEHGFDGARLSIATQIGSPACRAHKAFMLKVADAHKALRVSRRHAFISRDHFTMADWNEEYAERARLI